MSKMRNEAFYSSNNVKRKGTSAENSADEKTYYCKLGLWGSLIFRMISKVKIVRRECEMRNTISMSVKLNAAESIEAY